MNEIQQDLFQARQARDEGMGRVATRNARWMDEAMDRLTETLSPGEELTGEDLRVRLLNDGLAPPKHHNAWGAVIRSALTRNILAPTGRYRPMQTPASHARKTPVYVVRKGRGRCNQSTSAG